MVYEVSDRITKKTILTQTKWYYAPFLDVEEFCRDDEQSSSFFLILQ